MPDKNVESTEPRREGKVYALDARTATDHFPGIGRYVSNLAPAIAPLLREDEQLILITSPDSSADFSTIGSSGGRVRVVPLDVSSFSIGQQWNIRSQLRRQSVSLYHSPYILMPYWPGRPTVVTVHDLIPVTCPDYVSAKARLLFRQCLKLATCRASRVITDSQNTLRDLTAIFPSLAERASAITLAADERFKPQPPEAIDRVRATYSLPERYLLYVGSNKPHKNIEGLLAGFVAGQKRCSGKLHLVLAGAWDPGFPDPRAIAARYDVGAQVSFVSPVADSDLPALYGGAAVFAFPSFYEGFGFPVIEAMACGAPVACSNASSLPEVAGDAALLFAPDNPEAIGDAIARIWSDADLAAKLRENGFRQSARFSWERTAWETIKIYRLASGQAPSN